MTIDQFFDKVVEHYREAEKIISPYATNGNVFRNRQHSISSTLEDLFAHFLSCQFKERLPNIPVCFMVDYRICPDYLGNPLYPDIAIILEPENKPPCMVSYLDIKADLGFKREYFNSFPAIADTVKRLQNSKKIGAKNGCGIEIIALEKICWRTVVLTKENMPDSLIKKNESEALKWGAAFKLYFLSDGVHPNSKQRVAVNPIEEVFGDLMNDIENDIMMYLKSTSDSQL